MRIAPISVGYNFLGKRKDVETKSFVERYESGNVKSELTVTNSLNKDSLTLVEYSDKKSKRTACESVSRIVVRSFPEKYDNKLVSFMVKKFPNTKAEYQISGEIDSDEKRYLTTEVQIEDKNGKSERMLYNSGEKDIDELSDGVIKVHDMALDKNLDFPYEDVEGSYFKLFSYTSNK